MQIVTSRIELQNHLDHLRGNGKSIGLVPTMGFLHKGHISLIKRAVNENDFVVTTIFVNPLQFAAHEDLSTYPRDIEQDSALCEQAGTSIIFAPEVHEMFSDTVLTSITVNSLSAVLEGVSRPTHFAGVATVVSKIFNVVGPCNSYFGEKDWQQLQIIKKMVDDLSYRVNVIGCPIIRDNDGLALSSRNIYLSDEERNQASIIPQTLKNAHLKIKSGENSTQEIKNLIHDQLQEKQLISVDYVALVDSDSLEPVTEIDEKTRILVAVRIGSARLIDNINAHSGLFSS
tara:strand:- start:886 stop:1746 length:861 start_codon:yes stop_codon:yes gene_type:complete